MRSASWLKAAERVEASGGVELAVHPLSPMDAALDTLLIAGGEGIAAAATDTQLIDWVRERAKHARRTASVCTGAFLLAASGMLDGRRAVTHWAFCAELARRFPAVQVEPDPIFVEDGTVWTSAGVTAGIDLALALVEEDLGRAATLAVARYLVVFLKRPGGQAQFSEFLSMQTAEDRFGALHDWISNHLAGDLSLPVLAQQAGMSERSFSRHYAASTGLTPARAVERLRVEGARHLLSETPAGQAHFPALRLWLRRDDAPQFPAAFGHDAPRLSGGIHPVTSPGSFLLTRSKGHGGLAAAVLFSRPRLRTSIHGPATSPRAAGS
jgi:transcriptional regulator GlxA family with amidase domain